jgi:hypothetical protein
MLELILTLQSLHLNNGRPGQISEIVFEDFFNFSRQDFYEKNCVKLTRIFVRKTIKTKPITACFDQHGMGYNSAPFFSSWIIFSARPRSLKDSGIFSGSSSIPDPGKQNPSRPVAGGVGICPGGFWKSFYEN